jgi:hypothetical protein
MLTFLAHLSPAAVYHRPAIDALKKHEVCQKLENMCAAKRFRN